MLPTIIVHSRADLMVHIAHELNTQGFNASLNHLDVSNVHDMSGVFKDSLFNGDISMWNVSNVVGMVRMFENSPFNGDISRWNVSNVNTFAYMFRNSQFNGDISEWQLNEADNMLGMFEGSRFNGDLSKWNMSKVKEFRHMFNNADFAGDLSQTALRRYSTFANMFDASFQGVLPFSNNDAGRDKSYAGMLGGSSALKTYLKQTPFNTVHMDILLAATKKPGWVKPKDYEWVKEFANVAKGLGLSGAQTRVLAVQHYHDRTLTAIALPDMDFTSP